MKHRRGGEYEAPRNLSPGSMIVDGKIPLRLATQSETEFFVEKQFLRSFFVFILVLNEKMEVIRSVRSGGRLSV